VIFVRPHEAPPASTYAEGVDVALSSLRRNSPEALDPAIKSINLLNNVLAVREAQARGAVEALLLNQHGEVAEGASSNVFAVRAGRVVTPPLSAGILAGITRDIVIEVAPAAGHPVHEEPLSLDALRGADEAFLTSSLKEVAPIRRLDDRPVGTGRPGPVTLELLRAYRAALPSRCE
jgi:branched-chain amino acid aminotransferase